MCEIVDMAFVIAADKDDNYCPAVQLVCCQCQRGTDIVNRLKPFCERCCARLHYPLEIPADITRCDRCGLSIRGVLPLAMCVACQSITNYKGYNTDYVTRLD